MAFKIFKKKEKPDLSEEKEEVLSELPPPPKLPEIPPPPSLPNVEKFKEGFRSPEELKPPTELPPFKRPEPIPTPMPAPQPLTPASQPLGRISPEFEEVKAMPFKKRIPPHVFIRVDKYRDVMETLDRLAKQIEETKQDLEDINELGEKETAKLKEAAEVILKIESLLTSLQQTFTEPEE